MCNKLVEVYNLSSLNITKGSDANGDVGYYALDIYTSTSEESKLWTDENGYIFYEDGDTCYLVGYTGSETDLTLPESCNGKNYAIHQYAFYECDSLTSIEIPDGVETIGEYAFYFCYALKTVTFGENSQLLSIGNNAFYWCYNLTGIEIPDSVKTIGEDAFYDCYALKTVTFGEDSQLTSIGEEAFYYCYNLTSITIPDGVTSIGSSAFYSCDSLTSIEVASDNSAYKSIDGNLYTKDGKTLIQYAIGKTDTDFVIPVGVETIGSYAFYNCDSLTSITIPEGVETIGSYAFSYCDSLTSITIPDSVTSIGNEAFLHCSSLTSITIPDSVTSIGSGAFEYCYKLVEVYNLSSLNITKGSDANGYVGYYALNIYTPTRGESKLWTNKDGYTFYEDGDTCYLVGYTGSETELILPESYNGKSYEIYERAFYNCDTLTSITIPKGVKTIGEEAFYSCSALKTVTFGEDSQLTSIGEDAFSYCESLTSITIPDSVTSIGSFAFYMCNKLVEVYNLSSLNITKGSYANGCVGYYALDVYTSASEKSKLWTNEDGYIFYEDGDTCYLVDYTGSETNLTLPESCNGKNYSINKYAFCDNDSLTSITIPDSVTSIGEDAFSYCDSLTSITIPDGVTSIGSSAFYGCYDITIYSEAESEPIGWDENWNLEFITLYGSNHHHVVWGYKG